VTLDTGLYGGRTCVEIWVKSSVAATFNILASSDGVNWRKTAADKIELTAAGESSKGFFNAWRYIKVETSAANDNEIEITSSR